MSTQSTNLSPILFGRAQWEEVTRLPLQTANEMVAIGAIRSIKVGRRRLFLYTDVAKMFENLAASGKVLEPRKLYLQKLLKAREVQS